jgi:hypothetical protein
MVAAALAGIGLNPEEAALVSKLSDKLEAKRVRNEKRKAYYDGTNRVRQLGISIPPQLQRIETVVGWPSTAVDALAERLTIDGFSANADLDAAGVDEWWEDNRGPVESGMVLTDSLIYGVTFLAVSPGGPGEPEQLLTVEPASTMTGVWDARKRRLTAAMHVGWDDNGSVNELTLFTDTEVIEAVADGGRWAIDRRPHTLGRPPVFPLINKPRAGRPWGSSEITRPLMAYTDTAVRTLLGMEVAREFYSSPQRYILGADEGAFEDAEGNRKTAWETYLGRFLAIGADEDGNKPEVGQFTASSPAPYVEQVKLLAELVAAEGAMPVTYLGFHTDNPPGGDGIRAQETRLVKRAELRQATAGPVFADAVRAKVAMADSKRFDDPSLPRITTRWRDPSTPTKAATADAVTKYVAAGILPAQSEVTWELMGLDRATRERLAVEMRTERARQMTMSLRQAAAALPDAVDSPDR